MTAGPLTLPTGSAADASGTHSPSSTEEPTRASAIPHHHNATGSAVGAADAAAESAPPPTANADRLLPAIEPIEAADELADFRPRSQPSPPSSVASSSKIASGRTHEAPVASRSRSSSVSAVIKATFHRPSSSAGASAKGQSPIPPTKSKNRLRAGTWKGSSTNRTSTPSSRPELPTFDGGADRTPRASVYESFQDPRLAESSLHLVVGQPPSPASSHDAASGSGKRKLFGRSNSIRDLAKQASPEPARESHNILRRIGSRNFFGGSSSKDAMYSDNSGSSPVEGVVGNRQHSDSSRLAPSSAWHRKKGKPKQCSDSDSICSVSTTDMVPAIGVEAAVPVAASRERSSMESSRSTLSINSVGRAARPSLGDPRSDAHLLVPPPANNSAGLPKRLSGWLLNMMGNESHPISSDAAAPASAHPDRIDADRASVRSVSKSPSLGTSSPRADSPSRESEALPAMPPVQYANVPTHNTTRVKAGSLMYSFTGGPNKAARGGAHGAGAGASSGWVTGGAGFDRALKYFLDTESETEEGIWLLGVWHGPSRGPLLDPEPSNEADERAAEPQSHQKDTPASLDTQMTGTEESTPAVAAVKDCPDQSLAPHTASAPALAPTSADAGLAMSSPRIGSDDGFILARNPPTPLSSPAKTRSVKIRSQPSSAANTIRSTSTEQSERSSSPATSAQNHAFRTSLEPDWQAAFQLDFSSRVWCTYRNSFSPITRDGSISDQAASAAAISAEAEANAALQASSTPMDRPATANTGGGRSWLGRKLTESSVGRDGLTPASIANALGGGGAANLASSPSSLGDKMGITGLWGRATAAAQAAGFSRAGLTTDAGWGCMLRTGQSLLANALIDTHLGRSWTRVPAPTPQSKLMGQRSAAIPDAGLDVEAWADFREKRRAYAKYVRMLSWFLDDPSPACPFGVHRMAREGKRLGKEVGEWFGPSTAAGAIQALVSDFPEAGLGVALAHDGSVYLDEVRAAAALERATSSSHGARRRASLGWQRPVLILIGIRLGLEGVNPMYYDSVKATFSFPQTVGIAGGRPSSSYYFMGHQGNSLFYLDPHHVRPAVPLRYPPSRYPAATSSPNECLPEDNEDEWWAHAYTEPQLATFHCDKVRRMPIKSLDPSMLLGFLCKDETDLQDLCSRVKAMPKAIFAFADSAPRWADDDDFDPSMESFSESSVGEVEDDRDGDEDDNDPLAFPTDARPQDADERDPNRSAAADLPVGLQASSIAYVRPRSQQGEGTLAFPSIERPAVQPSDRTRTARGDGESRHVSGSSEATARAHPRSRAATGARRISNSMSANQPSVAPAPNSSATGDESFSTVSFSDSEVGSGWEEVSEGGTVACSGNDYGGGEAETVDGTGRTSELVFELSEQGTASLDAPTEEQHRPVMVTSSPSGYALNGAPLSLSAAKRHDRGSSSAHAPLSNLPRRRSRLGRSPCPDAETPSRASPEAIPRPRAAIVATAAAAAVRPSRKDSSDDDF
ncbi:Cysteine protease atg4 [Thecaphora frezii]